MAIYILIRKINENSEYAEYAFGENECALGILQIEKSSGKIIVVKETPEKAEFIAQRAGRKIFLHWKNNEFPDKTCWAA